VQLVSSLSRAIAHQLSLSVELVEAISLGHDLGHAPFGHDGEGYLSTLSQEAGIGFFSHSRQSCRIAEEIESLNLSFATLDGMLCHDAGILEPTLAINPEKTWSDYDQEMNLRLQQPEANLCPATNEAALVKLMDTVSSLERDIDDAIMLNIISQDETPLTQLRSQKLRDLVYEDVISTYRKKNVIGVSQSVFDYLKTIREFNFERIYSHNSLKAETQKVYNAYRLLFQYLVKDGKDRGNNGILWAHYLHNKSQQYIEKYSCVQHVVDYIAGMTDGYFLRLFQELFVPRSIEVPDVLPFS
jgi:dGTPase